MITRKQKVLFFVLAAVAVTALGLAIWIVSTLFPATSISEPTRDPMIPVLATSQAQQAEAVSALATQVAEELVVETTAELEEAVVEPTVTAVVVQNDLAAPNLFDADSCPPEENPGGCSLDVGVNPGQIGSVFGWHIAWPKGELDAGGEGCDLVILTPGWYENLLILDGRYEVYDVPSDYSGWVEVLGQQRAEEQAAHYSCPSKSFEDIPQWESSFPSPPN